MTTPDPIDEIVKALEIIFEESTGGTIWAESGNALILARSLLKELREAKEWKPIETAPKDGSHVLLYRPEIQFVGYYGGANSGWRISAPDLPAMWPLPTHWMQLPDPPAP